MLFSGLCASSASAESTRDVEMCRALVGHVRRLPDADQQAVDAIEQRWDSRDETFDAESFVTETLVALYPEFAAAHQAFADDDHETAAERFMPLLEHGDPYVEAGSLYFGARSLVEIGRTVTASRLLAEAVPRGPRLADYTPFVPQLYLQYALCEMSHGRTSTAAVALRKLEHEFPDAATSAHADAAELLAALEHARFKPLDQIANLMTHATARMRTAEVDDDVHERQERVVALLDKLIEQAEQSEQQQKQSSSPKPKPASAAAAKPGAPAAESNERAGSGEVGALHGTEPVSPGETWGQLQPQERERILQSLRQRYPARYRALVEQYYRSLSEEP